MTYAIDFQGLVDSRPRTAWRAEDRHTRRAQWRRAADPTAPEPCCRMNSPHASRATSPPLEEGEGPPVLGLGSRSALRDGSGATEAGAPAGALPWSGTVRPRILDCREGARQDANVAME